MSNGNFTELCRILKEQGYRADAASVFGSSIAYIASLESQLAALKPAAEAMGVLEGLVIAADAKIDEADGWYVASGRCGEFCGDGNSLIEAIKAASQAAGGGE